VLEFDAHVSTAILAVGRAGILPAVAGETTGKMPVGPTGWKPVPQSANGFNRGLFGNPALQNRRFALYSTLRSEFCN